MTIPMYSRSSDVRSIGLRKDCEAASVLSWLFNEPEPVWFPRGTALHYAIEYAILEGVEDKEPALHAGLSLFENALDNATNMGKHTVASSEESIDRMLSAWWEDVHPSSPKRKEPWANYYWPPKLVEHDIRLEDVGLYTQVDAVFASDNGDAIVDWKSSGKPKADKEQIQVYVYGLKREGLYQEGDTFGFFWFLDHGVAGWVDEYPGDEVIEHWIRETRTAKERIVETGMPRYTESWKCDYCQSKNICPVFSPETGKSHEEIALAIQNATLIEAPEVQ